MMQFNVHPHQQASALWLDLIDPSNFIEADQHHLLSYQPSELPEGVFNSSSQPHLTPLDDALHQTTSFTTSSKTTDSQCIDLYEFVAACSWHVLSRLPYLFYLVWPTETMFQSLDLVPRYVAEMFPVFFVAAIFENLIRLIQGRSSIRVNETVGSLSQGIFQECLRIKVRSIEVIMYCLIWNNFRLVSLSYESLWTWWLCYLAVDFGFYWAHRLAHEVNFIWAIHQAHHSSEEFSIVSALRQAVLQPFTAWFTYVPLAFFIPPQVFLAHLQLSELYMAWLHTEVVDKIGPLEYILNTPSHHRVHHSRNPEYIDKNYGGMLIIWDRLLGTFKAEDKSNPPVYGLVHPVKSFNPIRVQFHSWPTIWKRLKRAKTARERLAVLFFGPGWKPGGGRLGDITDIPKLTFPISYYDPPLAAIKKLYVAIHFSFLLFFYHELTLYQKQFQALVLNIGVLSLLASITSLGLMLDGKGKSSSVYELIRCILFFMSRHHLLPIISHSLARTGLSSYYRLTTIFFVQSIFLLSLLFISIDLLYRLLSDLQLVKKFAKMKKFVASKKVC